MSSRPLFPCIRCPSAIKIDIKGKIGDYEPLLDTVKRRKLQWFGHVTQRPGTLAHTVMHGGVDGRQGQGRLRRKWVDDVKKWVEEPVKVCIRMAEDRKTWRKTSQCPDGRNATGVT